ncbi:MAG: hypothetical protein ACR2IQ_03035 [Minisyncoccia bacterium]
MNHFKSTLEKFTNLDRAPQGVLIELNNLKDIIVTADMFDIWKNTLIEKGKYKEVSQMAKIEGTTLKSIAEYINNKTLFAIKIKGIPFHDFMQNNSEVKTISVNDLRQLLTKQKSLYAP